jgi:peptide/nickel transport system ATP-binding protein
VNPLEVRDLNVWFELPHGGTLHAVRGVDFDLRPGETYGLVGESGCGKSTICLALMGLLPANATVSGEIRLDGRDLLAGGEDMMRTARWNTVAMVFQGAMNAFNPVRRIGHQIVEPMELHGIASGAAARRRAVELLATVGIPEAAFDRYPHEFSGGMRQRAAIAMALSCEPSILLADEPTTALDVMVQAQILAMLDALSRDLGLTLLLVTHDLPVVAQTCTRAAVMYAGEIVEEASVDDLYHQPRHPYTRMLFAATPSLDSDEDIISIPGTPPRLDQPLTGCPFRWRCDSNFERCETETPPLVSWEPEHRAACHLNDLARTEAPR